MRFCRAITFASLIVWSSCPGSSAPPPAEPLDLGQAPGLDAAVPTASDAAPEIAAAIGETEARAILADAFRRAGYRILYDHIIVVGGQTVAIDGYDPREQVGYEYIAADELATAASVRAIGGEGILIVEPSPREDVAKAVADFVEKLAQP